MPNPLAKLITERQSTDAKIESRSWHLTYRGKPTLGHIGPSLSLAADENKLRLLFRAELSPQQASCIGSHMIESAESMENFTKPLVLAQRRIPGRHWEVKRIGDDLNAPTRQRYVFITPLHNFEDRGGIVRLQADADITPRQARQIGGYLLSAAAQVQG